MPHSPLGLCVFFSVILSVVSFLPYRRNGDSNTKFVSGAPITHLEYQASHDLPPAEEGKDISLNYRNFEGDILPSSYALYWATENRRFGKGLHTWKNGVVPYVIENTFTPAERLQVARAFSEIESVSCVRFVPKKEERSFVYIQKGKDCASHVGRMGGGQPISLSTRCAKYGIIMHELLHALGFWHEQSRYDRTDYIDIHWTNIQPMMIANFLVNPHYWMSDVGLPYDYESILHYAPDTFARRPSMETITPKQNGVSIGQRDKLSKLNIEGINLLYGCSDSYEQNAIDGPDHDHLNRIAAGRGFVEEEGCLDLFMLCWPSRLLGGCWWGDYLMRRYCRATCDKCTL